MAEWILAAAWLRQQDRVRRVQRWAEASSCVTGVAALGFVWEPCSASLGAVLLAGVLVQVALEAWLALGGGGRTRARGRVVLLAVFALLLQAALLASDGPGAGRGCVGSAAPPAATASGGGS